MHNGTFEEALHQLKKGESLQRLGWNGKGMYIFIMVGNIIDNIFHSPYIAIKGTDGSVTPWLAAQTDILANDWILFKE